MVEMTMQQVGHNSENSDLLTFSIQLDLDWRSEECKLTPTLKFNLLTLNIKWMTQTCHVLSSIPPAKFGDDTSSGFYLGMCCVHCTEI